MFISSSRDLFSNRLHTCTAAMTCSCALHRAYVVRFIYYFFFLPDIRRCFFPSRPDSSIANIHYAQKESPAAWARMGDEHGPTKSIYYMIYERAENFDEISDTENIGELVSNYFDSSLRVRFRANIKRTISPRVQRVIAIAAARSSVQVYRFFLPRQTADVRAAVA